GRHAHCRRRRGRRQPDDAHAARPGGGRRRRRLHRAAQAAEIRGEEGMSEERKLRSTAWFGGEGKNASMHRSWMKNQGFPADEFDGRPVIGICNTWSELTPCNAHLRGIAERVKRGVYEAGGLPL